MTTTTKAKPAARIFTGKGAMLRETAMLKVAPLAFAEEQSRAAMVDNLSVVLGKSPTEEQRKAARVQTTIGYVASRLPVSLLPKGKTKPEDRLARASDLVCRMAKPPEPGKKANKLRAGQIGRRSAAEQKIVRAAEERAGRLFAELGFSGAKTIAAKNKAAEQSKATRAPSMAGSGKGKAKAAAPDHSVLVQPVAVTSDDYVQHMQTQLAALVAFDAKHAKKRPTTHTEFAEQLGKLKQLANKSANDYQVRKAKAEAEAKK